MGTRSNLNRYLITLAVSYFALIHIYCGAVFVGIAMLVFQGNSALLASLPTDSAQTMALCFGLALLLSVPITAVWSLFPRRSQGEVGQAAQRQW